MVPVAVKFALYTEFVVNLLGLALYIQHTIVRSSVLKGRKNPTFYNIITYIGLTKDKVTCAISIGRQITLSCYLRDVKKANKNVLKDLCVVVYSVNITSTGFEIFSFKSYNKTHVLHSAIRFSICNVTVNDFYFKTFKVFSILFSCCLQS